MRAKVNARIGRRQRKIMQTVAKSLLQDEALIFKKVAVRTKGEYTEKFVLLERTPAHFYTISRSGSSLNNIAIENGQEESESLLRIMLLRPVGKTADRVVPIINGMIGGREGDELYELMETPLDAAKQGITYESPIKLMDIPYEVVEKGDTMELVIKGAT